MFEPLPKRKALTELIKSAQEVNLCWDHTGANMLEGYPKCLPSFDEFINQLIEWRDKQSQ